MGLENNQKVCSPQSAWMNVHAPSELPKLDMSLWPGFFVTLEYRGL